MLSPVCNNDCNASVVMTDFSVTCDLVCSSVVETFLIKTKIAVFDFLESFLMTSDCDPLYVMMIQWKEGQFRMKKMEVTNGTSGSFLVKSLETGSRW